MLGKISNVISLFSLTFLLLWHICETSPLTRHVRIARSLQTSEPKLSQKDIDEKLTLLKYKKRELLKYKRILEDLNEILTEYDDNEYVDLSENELHHEDLLEILKHLEKLEVESRAKESANYSKNKEPIQYPAYKNSYNKKKSTQLKPKIIEYDDDYDPKEMQSDMPGRNDLDSGEESEQNYNSNLSPSILEKFNLTREDLLALSTRMQNSGKSTLAGRDLYPSNGRSDVEGAQQDASITMSPQQLREVFNLTVNGDGKVQYDRNLAKQLALQQIRKSVLTYFVHSGTQTGTKVADQTQLEQDRPANLNRNHVPRHAITEAHRAFLTHAQQMQDQPTDMSLSRNNAGIDVLSSTFTEKNIAFHPRCELPKNTDPEAWHNGNALNLLFNVSSSIRPERPNLTLETATLRIYKLSSDFKHNSGNDDQIRISVSWYTRSLKKHRVKRKLSDSKMVPLSFTGWIELNLRGAVASWKTTTRNHGIVITVEDQEGNALRTDAFIQKHDCSNLYPRPFPWVVHKKFPIDDEDISYKFPRLDIQTRELVSYNYQGLPSLVNTFHQGVL